MVSGFLRGRLVTAGIIEPGERTRAAAMSEEFYGPRTRAWAALGQRADILARVPITRLFDEDPLRGHEFSTEAEGLWLDLSRQRIDSTTLGLLLELAEQTRLPDWIERMFRGERINNTEDRAALHIALRRPADRPLLLDGDNIMPLVEAERDKMRALADSLHGGSLRGYTGRRITDVVNIGIGGSDLGILMAVEALDGYRMSGLGVHFVSNIDGVQLSQVLRTVDPETTLFVVCSKTFTTLETLTNARAIREWLIQRGGPDAVASQFVAVSTNHQAMDEFGIAPQHRLDLWDWVGGRYSICSAAGLVLALAIGWKNFAEFLAGAHQVDEHFRSAPLERNLPVLLALSGIFNRNFLGASNHAVLPYDQHLNRLPAYLQQLEMESNGKSVRRGGEPVECATAPVIWGEPGSNAQHSFYQLFHQGSEPVSIDFLLPASSMVDRQEQQDLAALNCLAQAWALAAGDPESENVDSHRDYPANRPTTLILFPRLDPATLGKLIALYEHKVFTQGVIWDVNSFDQWGVELGKRLVTRLQDPGTADTLPPIIAPAFAKWREWRS